MMFKNCSSLALGASLLGGCTTPIPDALHVASDTGGLMAPKGLCTDRNAAIGSAPIERINLELDCTGPDDESRVRSCMTANLQMRFTDGDLILLSGLSELQVEVLLPQRDGGRAVIRVMPLEAETALSDGLWPQLRIDVPTYLSQRSLQVVDEAQPDSCTTTEGCGLMGMAAVSTDDDAQEQYPLGHAASGVLLLDGIGWDEDPVVIELEVPFFAPDGEEAMTCTDGLIHYRRQR